MSPAVPYTRSSAAASARRPAPLVRTRVPSMSKRTSRTRALAGRPRDRDGEGAEARHNGGQAVEDGIHLGGGAPAAQREAERAVGLGGRAADRAQDMGRRLGEGGAGRAGRRGNALE